MCSVYVYMYMYLYDVLCVCVCVCKILVYMYANDGLIRYWYTILSSLLTCMSTKLPQVSFHLLRQSSSWPTLAWRMCEGQKYIK